METRSDKFKRIATKRTNSVLEQLRLLGNLANRSNYEYYNDDVSKIFSAIETQLKSVKASFIKNSGKSEFKL